MCWNSPLRAGVIGDSVSNAPPPNWTTHQNAAALRSQSGGRRRKSSFASLPASSLEVTPDLAHNTSCKNIILDGQDDPANDSSGDEAAQMEALRAIREKERQTAVKPAGSGAASRFELTQENLDDDMRGANGRPGSLSAMHDETVDEFSDYYSSDSFLSDDSQDSQDSQDFRRRRCKKNLEQWQNRENVDLCDGMITFVFDGDEDAYGGDRPGTAMIRTERPLSSLHRPISSRRLFGQRNPSARKKRSRT